jgi:hypothetical protein
LFSRLGDRSSEVKTIPRLFRHHMTLELKSKKVILGGTHRTPTYRLNKENAGVSNHTPADVDEPELPKGTLEF